MKLYVGSLQYTTTEADLHALFSHYGDIHEVTLIKDLLTGESKGFGFVQMKYNSDADKAIKSLNGSAFHGRNIKVNQAQPKSKENKSTDNKSRWRPGMY